MPVSLVRGELRGVVCHHSDRVHIVGNGCHLAFAELQLDRVRKLPCWSRDRAWAQNEPIKLLYARIFEGLPIGRDRRGHLGASGPALTLLRTSYGGQQWRIVDRASRTGRSGFSNDRLRAEGRRYNRMTRLVALGGRRPHGDRRISRSGELLFDLGLNRDVVSLIFDRDDLDGRCKGGTREYLVGFGGLVMPDSTFDDTEIARTAIPR